MHVYGELSGTLTAPQGIIGTLSTPQGIEGMLTIPQYVLPPSYSGSYEVTPSDTEQVLETENLYMTDNITINPIPNNYGLITYNGSTITVS
jgi:hypothetical protein